MSYGETPFLIASAPNGARKTKADLPSIPITPAELALAASTKVVAVKTATAADYLKFMLRAGYVRRNAGRYSFVRARDPGPLAPQIQRVKQVFDPNSKTVVWPKGGTA